MCRDQNIPKRQQPRQVVILKDLAGKVFEKNASFFFIDVETHTTDLARL
jgi:hypothetical protein